MFSCAVGHLYIFSGEMYLSPFQFFNGIVFHCRSLFFLISWILIPRQIYNLQILFPMGSLFSINSVLWCTKGFSFDGFQLTYFLFVACTFGVISKKSLLNPVSWNFSPMFSSKSFMVKTFIFRSLIHWSYFCIGWVVRVHYFACAYSVFPTVFVEKTVFSLLNGFDALDQNHFPMYVGFISLFYSAGL